MKMVEILLAFIRADRTGNWKLHISAFELMLPQFAVHNHTLLKVGSGIPDRHAISTFNGASGARRIHEW